MSVRVFHLFVFELTMPVQCGGVVLPSSAAKDASNGMKGSALEEFNGTAKLLS
jgi:hypothetical protein